jgi:hypothetical protein
LLNITTSFRFSQSVFSFTLKLLFSLNDLQNTKIPKLIKKLENNKAKGLAYAN